MLSGMVKSSMNKDGMISNMMNTINAMAKGNGVSSPSQAQLNNRVLEIPYILDGREYVMHVPYNRRKPRNVIFNIVKDDETFVIDHHPCTPFLVTANCLNVDEVHVEKSDDIAVFTAKDKVDF